MSDVWRENWDVEGLPGELDGSKKDRGLTVRFEGVGRRILDVSPPTIYEEKHHKDRPYERAKLAAAAPRLYRVVERALMYMPEDLRKEAVATLDRARHGMLSNLWRKWVGLRTLENAPLGLEERIERLERLAIVLFEKTELERLDSELTKAEAALPNAEDPQALEAELERLDKRIAEIIKARATREVSALQEERQRATGVARNLLDPKTLIGSVRRPGGSGPIYIVRAISGDSADIEFLESNEKATLPLVYVETDPLADGQDLADSQAEVRSRNAAEERERRERSREI